MGVRRIIVLVGPTGVAPSVRKDLYRVLDTAQEVILVPAESSVEHPLIGGRDVADLYASLCGMRPRRFLARCETDAFEHVCRSWRIGDSTILVRLDDHTIVTGSDRAENPLDYLLPKLPSERCVWIGHGTNTWKSDLNLAVSYRHTSGRANVAGATLGIPWMVGIPGTVGGWIKMNAGAFGHSISEVLEAICIDGAWYSPEDCSFGYRHSNIVGEIQDFRLRPYDSIKIEGSSEYYLQRRRKFPARTFGSFFKNPPGMLAGKLLECAGVKTLRVGGAYVWNEHANVIVFDNSYTPSDVLALARLMMVRVYETATVWLEPEVCGLVR